MTSRVTALERPPRLVAGDRVAIVAPSGPVLPERLDAGLDVFRGWGFDPVVFPHVREVGPRLSYLAGSDEARARDVEDAWCDPSIAAVISARGGFGAQRVVDLLDWERMARAEPKAFIGFSDATALHEAIARRLGVATLYGPMAAAEVFVTDPPTQEHLRATLLEPESVQTLSAPASGTIVGGRAAGVTVGGCLTLLTTDLGTPFARATAAGGILLLEDVALDPYELDRTLTQLARAGLLDGVSGIAIGSLSGHEPYDNLRTVLVERLGPLGVPVVDELGFGHGPTSLTVPLGVPCVLDADARTLTLELPALAAERG
ncbi:MAG TPA: LD-carboxypeptidase [Gaiella sp.]|nr:LD-carboxypeptidase [Gaiella sp.]